MHSINKKIYFEENELEIEAFKVIAKYLQDNEKITRLFMIKNQLRDEAGDVLSNAIKGNRHLVWINMVSCAIRTKGAKLIFDALENNETLTEINFSSLQGLYRNKIGAPAMEPLGNLLKTNNSIAILNLSGNCIWDDGLEYLWKGIGHGNKGLIEFDIGANYITSVGWESLADWILKSNIERLNLEENKITSYGLEKLCKIFIKKTWPITHLNIKEWGIDAIGMNHLMLSLKLNTSITHLKLNGNNVFQTSSIKFLMENADK